MGASCDTLGLRYLLLDVVDLRSQPLDHAVDLSDLLLGVAQVVPVSARCDLQLLVLKTNRKQEIYVSFNQQDLIHF